MEEAGDKMEGNIDEIKINYSQRMQKLEDIIKKVKIQLNKSMDVTNLSLHFSWLYQKRHLPKIITFQGNTYRICNQIFREW